MSLLIKNGEIATPTSAHRRHLLRRRNDHAHRPQSSMPRPARRSIDATGKYVFPGFIDPHVHIYLPFMGTFAKDTYETASKAALVGGTTTLIEMCCPSRADEAAGRFRAVDVAGGRASRVRFHVPHGRDEVRRARPRAQLREIVGRGIVRSKSSSPTKARSASTTTELYHTLKLAQGTGRDRHGALRKRNARRRAAEGIARRGQDRARSGITRAGRRGSRRKACIT